MTTPTPPEQPDRPVNPATPGGGAAAMPAPPVARPGATPGAEAGAAEAAPVLGRLPAPVTPPAAPARVSSQPWAKREAEGADEGAAEAGWTAGGDTIMLGGAEAAGQSTGDTTRLRAGVALAGQATRVAAPPAVATPALAEPVGGTVYGGNRAAAAERESLAGRPVDQLRLDWHRAPVAALDSIHVPQAVTGLLLGADDAKGPVVVRLFRPEVTRVAMVGGLWLVRLLVFRSLGLGARVIVFTNRPTAWQGFGEAATGRSDRLVVLDAERPVAVAASPSSPVLHVYDLGTGGPTQAAPLGPWNAQLTVLPTLTAFGFAAIEAAHLTLLRRLSESEAAAATPVLRLAGATPTLVQQVRDDMVTVVGAGQARFTFLRPTGVESSMLGSPSTEPQPAAAVAAQAALPPPST